MASGGFSLTTDIDNKYDPYYVLGVINSTVLFFSLRSISNIFRGDWITCTRQYFSALPIRRIAFDAADTGDTAPVLEEACREYDRSLSSSDAAVQALPDSLNLNEFPDIVYHDFIAHAVRSLITIIDRHDQLERAVGPWKFIQRRTAHAPATDVLADAFKYASIDHGFDLSTVHHDIDGLRLTPADDDRWLLEIQLKKRDPDTDWEEWIKEEDGRAIAREWVPALRLPMDEEKGRYYQHAFRVLDDFENFTSFPGGKTRSTMKKLQLTQIPEYDPEVDLEPLVELSRELEELERRIRVTDELIDQIVYRLYGLTDEEIALVEESVG